MTKWIPTTAPNAEVIIDKHDGTIIWNMIVQQYLAYPRGIKIWRDSNKIALCSGDDLSVVQNTDGMFYVNAKDVLIECGLSFPLSADIVVCPCPNYGGLNMIVINIP